MGCGVLTSRKPRARPALCPLKDCRAQPRLAVCASPVLSIRELAAGCARSQKQDRTRNARFWHLYEAVCSPVPTSLHSMAPCKGLGYVEVQSSCKARRCFFLRAVAIFLRQGKKQWKHRTVFACSEPGIIFEPCLAVQTDWEMSCKSKSTCSFTPSRSKWWQVSQMGARTALCLQQTGSSHNVVSVVQRKSQITSGRIFEGKYFVSVLKFPLKKQNNLVLSLFKKLLVWYSIFHSLLSVLGMRSKEKHEEVNNFPRWSAYLTAKLDV